MIRLCMLNVLKGNSRPVWEKKKPHTIKSFFYFLYLTKSQSHLYPLTLDASSLNTPSLFCAHEPKHTSNTLKSFHRTLCGKITHGQWCHVARRSVSCWLVRVTLCVCWTWVGRVRSRPDRMHLVWQDEEERRELLFDRDKKLHFGLSVKKEI